MTQSSEQNVIWLTQEAFDKLQDELLQLQAQLKKTILFVSHDLDEALKLGSTIAIMEGGRIVQCGTPRDIFTASPSAR